ncbi:MAG: MBL fold metallo-hydrolase [Cycloclasticus sp. symbiont of Poecilosclerida sp. M]|nr:MAG: MBL fold metallo-hydrolase [Cycloclasticus sp. symbiont of Poecilosclerida sp. M]
MIDNGFSTKETVKRLARLGVEPEQITAILVTHEHADHATGVARFSSRYQTPVWASFGTAAMLKDVADIQCFNSHQTFEVEGIQVEPVPVPHDAKEPTQFVFTAAGCKFGIMTDAGSITTHMVGSLSDCNALLLECNYDHTMLMDGVYPESLKRRVSSDWGHLSNDQSIELLKQLDTKKFQYLALGHVSDKNNSHARVLDCVSQAIDCDRAWLQVVDQSLGLAWQTINLTEDSKENIHA